MVGRTYAAIARGRAVKTRHLRIWMRAAVKELHPYDTSFKASESWALNFMRRNNFVRRRRSNKKAKSPEERREVVRQWHKRLQKEMSQGGGSDHPITGRYAPTEIYNIDQSPLMLQTNSEPTTIAQRGAPVVQIATKEGADKRFATLQITVRLANGVPQPRIAIIFRGKGQRRCAEEVAQYDSRVDVYFQPKAWVDEEMAIKHFEGAFVPFVEQESGGRALLFMDNLGSQSTESFRAVAKRHNVMMWYFPPGCTDMLQPVDRHLAQQVKQLISQKLEDKLIADNAFADEWLGLEKGTYPAWKCRVLLTQLAGDAWDEVCAKRDFEHLGYETGCLMVREGLQLVRSKGQQIKIDGLPDYEFESCVLPAAEPDEEASLLGDDAKGVESDEDADSSGESDGGEEKMEKLDIVPDYEEVREMYGDDTYEPPTGVSMVVPEGFVAEPLPDEMPTATKLLTRSVLWLVDVTADGVPGWIRSEVAGGPSDPAARARGVTMRLKCTKRLDKATPREFFREEIEVAHNLENYGTQWVLLGAAPAIAAV